MKALEIVLCVKAKVAFGVGTAVSAQNAKVVVLKLPQNIFVEPVNNLARGIGGESSNAVVV